MKTTPKDFFLNFGIMVSLIWVATSTIVVLFDLINIFVPDALSMSYGYGSVAQVSTFALSSLIIITPILIFLTRLNQKDLIASPEKVNNAIRRWLMYITLFLSAVTVITDLVVAVNILLSGGLTLRFILQALAIFFVAGGTFGYVFFQLKRDYTKTFNDKILAWSSIVVVILLVIVSVIVSGTPQKQRHANYDINRLNSLVAFEQMVLAYYQANSNLPDNQSEFTDALGYPTGPVDPITKEPFVYEKTGPLSFKICANFDGDFDDIPDDWTTYNMARSVVQKNWDFEKGQSCFDRTIDPTKITDFQKPIF